jgi:1,4-dihydroxy-2-naphthoate octaprenyltransferase
MKITKNIRNLILIWLFAIPQYVLGLAIIKYLGLSINWDVFWLGLIWVILIGIVSIYVFSLSDKMSQDRQILRYKIRELPFRNWLLTAGFVISVLLIVTIALVQTGFINPIAGFLMMLIFLGTFFLGVRPLRLFYSGFGELVMALVIGFFIPALSLQFQSQDLHRLLIFTAVPITLLFFSFQLAAQVKEFATESKLDEKRLIARIGWENGFILHNSFIIFAYFSIGVAGLLGLPRSIALPVFISFPLAGLQIWHLQQIANGKKPRWKFLQINNILIISMVILILVISFFIR